MVKSTPIRGELEGEEFTCEALVQSYFRTDVEVLTVPLVMDLVYTGPCTSQSWVCTTQSLACVVSIDFNG